MVSDLEWNSAYYHKKGAFINEIIEIGAVKLDENLNVISTFETVIKPTTGAKLRGFVKELTHITNDDLKRGKTFSSAISDFSVFFGNDSIFVSWGTEDIRELCKNINLFEGHTEISFIKKYVDLQSYVMEFEGFSNSRQPGLSEAAKKLSLNPDDYIHHRALADSILASDILKQKFNINNFKKHIKKCDEKFYGNMLFKPFVITEINDHNLEKKEMQPVCPNCKMVYKKSVDWKVGGGKFSTIINCPECNTIFCWYIRAKKYYDKVKYKKSSRILHKRNGK
ncbi:MAG: exonuclease domain-containing protein [Candidatus Fimenecus sp.]